MNPSTFKPGGVALRWALYILCLLPSFAQAQAVDSLINSLADPDSNQRLAAERQLSQMGREARPALVSASRSPSPAIAAASARILLSLPWYRATDPMAVQVLLREYGNNDEAGRMRIISDLAQLPNGSGLQPLLRLIVEDPSEDVCWKIVTHLTRHVVDSSPFLKPEPGAAARLLSPPDSRPAALTLSAIAWIDRDPKRAVPMLEKALQIELRQPSFDDGNLDFAFDVLVEEACRTKGYAKAADLRRIQTTRIGVTRDAYPRPIYQLFGLHARFGPIAGFEGDIESYRDYLGHGQVLYSMAQIYERSGRTIEALGCRHAALATGLTVDSKFQTGKFLVQHGWPDLARREYQAIAAVDDVYVPVHIGDQVLKTLAALANRDDADAIASGYFEGLRNLISQPGVGWTDGSDRKEEYTRLYTCEILWRQARIALARGDRTAADELLNQLMTFSPDDTDVIQNSYPMLVSMDRKAEALQLFKLGEARLRKSMAENPDAPVWWNDLAWLSARCDQKLEEALALAKRAVAAEPENTSYLDTLAEVHFRLGNAQEAVKLEIQALEIDPGDIFMTKQLERFKAGPKP